MRRKSSGKPVPRNRSGREEQGGLVLSDTRVLVVGWARSGRAAARVLHERGARVWANDLRAADALRAEAGDQAFPDWLAGAFWGGHPESLAGQVDLVVVSPGIAPDLPLLEAARARGVPVVGELELAARLGRAPILGVTGTNGKSTVVTLLGECFRAAARPAVVAGNVGLPLVSIYPQLGEETTAVVEISSYQLETIERFHARGAVILNLQPDHLGRHRTMTAYRQAKARLLDTQTPADYAVLFRDDPEVARLASHVKGKLLEVSLGREVSQGGMLSPRGDLELVMPQGKLALLPREELPLPGEHNVVNALSAAVAAFAWGLPAEAISQALRFFRGLPHRIERVGWVGNVLLVNDSKATNVDSTLAALRATAPPLVLMGGGFDKGLSFAPLREELRRRARAIVLFGQAAGRMAQELHGTAPIRVVETMVPALREALELAAGEGAILFSPGCSSFDQFRDFEERGDAFREACREIRGFRPATSPVGAGGPAGPAAPRSRQEVAGA